MARLLFFVLAIYLPMTVQGQSRSKYLEIEVKYGFTSLSNQQVPTSPYDIVRMSGFQVGLNLYTGNHFGFGYYIQPVQEAVILEPMATVQANFGSHNLNIFYSTGFPKSKVRWTNRLTYYWVNFSQRVGQVGSTSPTDNYDVDASCTGLLVESELAIRIVGGLIIKPVEIGYYIVPLNFPGMLQEENIVAKAGISYQLKLKSR
jgi:hypothetical protein